MNAKLIAITKKLCSAWARSQPDNAERVRLTDQFLDLVAGKDVPADPPNPTDLDRYRADAEGWKAEAERFELRLREVSTALGEDWNVMPPDQAVTAIKNRLAMAEAARDEWARRAEQYRAEVMILEAVVDRVKEAVNPNPAEG